MDLTTASPLDELEDAELYRLLGDAWYAQFQPRIGDGYFLAPSAEVGKREYDKLAPLLREELRRSRRYGVVACVTSTIQRADTWRMPASVVAVLAVRHGLAQSEPPAASTAAMATG